MSGQLNHNHSIHSSGQGQQTLKRNHHTRNNFMRTKKTTNKGRATSMISMPRQPAEQEIMEHNFTHMPYRSWCPICIQGRGRSDAHPQRSSSRPIILIDFAFPKGAENQYPTPVLTAIDIATGSATLVPNKATVSTTSLPSIS